MRKIERSDTNELACYDIENNNNSGISSVCKTHLHYAIIVFGV